MAKVIGIIPIRYGSTRLPAKALVNILGKTLIQRTYENARRCPLFTSLVVATDDQRIYDHVKNFGGDVVMTSTECATGTDRLAETVRNNRCFDDVDIVVNIQGDEPVLDLGIIQQVIEILLQDPQAVMSTAITRLTSEEEAKNPSVNKCVIDKHGNALYFSRSLIPGGKQLDYREGIAYYKHIGIYGYRREFLLIYASLPATPLQKAEDLEQLKVLEHGYRIKTAIVEGLCMGVDTPEDIKKIEQLLCKQSSYSSQAGFVHP
jgi:3-deoxy-manno-octulosonate cytidylyltransferase (CMP-KDO synthetase)